MTALKRAILYTLVTLMVVSLSGWLIKTIQAQVQFTGTDDKSDMRSALNAADAAELLAVDSLRPENLMGGQIHDQSRRNNHCM